MKELNLKQNSNRRKESQAHMEQEVEPSLSQDMTYSEASSLSDVARGGVMWKLRILLMHLLEMLFVCSQVS